MTDVSYLFCARSSSWYAQRGCNTAAKFFNEDIGAWDTSGVTTMWRMFLSASAFNQDIGDWAVHSVTNMEEMFRDASAFNQDLGWCVDDGVDLSNAFYKTPRESTSCGVMQKENPGDCDVASTGNVMVNYKIRLAVTTWLANPTAAEATYGHISTWETGGVSDMSYLFHSKGSFNEDIGAWDTSGVTTMYGMFKEASAFNRDIGGWAVHSVTDMSGMFWGASAFNRDISGWAVHSVTSMVDMFYYASAFDQDLGWCVDDDVSLSYTFYDTLCESTSCGVTQVDGGCAPTLSPTTPAPTPGALGSDGAAARSVALCFIFLGAALA